LLGGLSGQFAVRAMDVQPMPEGPWKGIAGNATDAQDCMRLCEGCSALVIAHMAPNRPEIYATPTIPFDVNVKGTANLFEAAVAHGIRRVVLISSTGVVQGHTSAGEYLKRDLPAWPKSMYGLTKALQEEIAQYYHRQNGIEVAMLRPAHIINEDNLVDKYGKCLFDPSWGMIDPRDIAQAVRLALLSPNLGFEVFYTLGHPDAAEYADVQHTRDFLGWRPEHTFQKHSAKRDGKVLPDGDAAVRASIEA
jgi:nucleoside-diphosphate-sugar epimerase